MRHLIFIVILSSINAFAQTSSVVSKDTTLFDKYSGKLKFGFYLKDSTITKHGRISFASELLKDYSNKKFNKLIFTGNYHNGIKAGNWSYTESNFDVMINDVKEAREFSLDYSLTGIEYRITMSFLLGVPDGKWNLTKSIIQDKKRNARSNFGTLNFKFGYLTDEVNYENEIESVKFKANINASGFLDGMVNISYPIDNQIINEVRFYKDGFLIKLERYYSNEKTAFEAIEFTDIISKLENFENYSDFEVSDEGFGILFNNGYANDDKRLTIQHQGNDVFNNLLSIFNRYLAKSDENEYQKPIYKLTRRLKYSYPSYEDSLVKELRFKLNELCGSYDEFVNQPRYKLYKEKSDTLSYAMAFVNMANVKCDIINEELKRIESGFFEYQFRDNFYHRGIKGINRKDSIRYLNVKGDTVTSEFSMNTKIRSSESLIDKMMDYILELKSRTDIIKKIASDQVKLFKEQDDIDELDSEIIRYQELNDSLYSYEPVKRENLNTLNFSQKLYLIYTKNHIKELKNIYLNADEFEEKKALGTELSCLLKQFAIEYKRIQIIDKNHRALDSTFTVFKEHPFDDRLFESTILANIKDKGGNVLFNHYTEELFRSGKCKDLINGLVKIERLQARLVELAKQYEKEEVVQINRFIRRENVPSRIERMLEIN